MPKNVINIEVLGYSIPISADEDSEYLERLLETYRQKLDNIQQTTGLKDPTKTAILTGFLLCDECEKTRFEKTRFEKTRFEKTTSENNTGEEEHHSQAIHLINDETKEAEHLTLSLISKLGKLLDLDEYTKELKIFRLQNIIKNYEWGSRDWIPDLLNKMNVNQMPWAELWMGVHPEGQSKVIDIFAGENPQTETALLLSELISRDKKHYLGNTGFDTLPFLFKVLAAEKPLSIQAHPSLEQAQEGWARESSSGIDLESPLRNYRDPSHKPEIICALSPFTAMVGFRETEEIKTLLMDFFDDASRSLKAAIFPLINALDRKNDDDENPLKKFLSALFSMTEETRADLSDYAINLNKHKKEWELIKQFASLYPGDPAIISPLYLNIIDLEPGDAIFIPSGMLHAYIHGLGIELMANSNNVLRGGLTNKHIDTHELLNVLDFKSYKPLIFEENKNENIYTYPVLCREFSLCVIKGGMGEDYSYPESGPSIILVTNGELTLTINDRTISLKKGESAFIPANDGKIMLSGDFTLYAAGIGNENSC